MSHPNEGINNSAIRGLGIGLNQILDSLPDGVTIQDRNFTVVYQNRTMLAAFGNRLGMKCYAAYERRDAKCDGCGVIRVFSNGEPTLVLRTAFNAQGETSYWENACFPIRDESGSIIAAAEVCRNISDRVGLEEEVKHRNIELGQLNKQLQRRTAELTETFQKLEGEIEQRERADIELRQAQKLRAVGQLAAGIAHELNTPAQFVGDNIQFLASSFRDLQQLLAKYREVLINLTAVPGCELLAQEVRNAEEAADLVYLEENIPSALDHARVGIAQISSIVSALKEFARPDQREKSAADLNRALQVAITIARNEYKFVAEVETELADIPPVICHLSDLNQVFLNLLVNAAHAIADVVGRSGNKGRIQVRTRCEGENVCIDIADTGCGIPKSIQERVFEPFFTTKEVGRGSGQGLAIARSIVVDKHGGSLTFESEEGKGTTFAIRLPVTAASSAPAAMASSDMAIRALTATLRELT
jgi:signal transduction histidine kinase